MNKIKFVIMKNTSSISLTGAYCFLACNHCNKHYLKSMKSVTDISNLINQGKTSFLLSGGMLEDITIPVYNFRDLIISLKEKYPVKFNMHTGVMSEEQIDKTIDLADVISFDIVGNRETVIDVYNYDYFDKMIESFNILMKKNVKVAPHITIGLNGGNLTHEIEAVNILYNHFNKKNVEKLIFNVFIPTKGSKFESELPPDIEKVKEIIEYGKNLFKETEIVLGCMIPKGSYRLQLQETLINYVNTITQPVNKVIEKCKKLDYSIEYSYECCAF